jgi:hypothetical protein
MKLLTSITKLLGAILTPIVLAASILLFLFSSANATEISEDVATECAVYAYVGKLGASTLQYYENLAGIDKHLPSPAQLKGAKRALLAIALVQGTIPEFLRLDSKHTVELARRLFEELCYGYHI